MTEHDDRTAGPGAAPTRAQICGYIEEIVLQLADMASARGETALAAALALVSIQASSSKAGRVAEPAPHSEAA